MVNCRPTSLLNLLIVIFDHICISQTEQDVAIQRYSERGITFAHPCNSAALGTCLSAPAPNALTIRQLQKIMYVQPKTYKTPSDISLFHIFFFNLLNAFETWFWNTKRTNQQQKEKWMKRSVEKNPWVENTPHHIEHISMSWFVFSSPDLIADLCFSCLLLFFPGDKSESQQTACRLKAFSIYFIFVQLHFWSIKNVIPDYNSKDECSGLADSPH